MRKKKNINFDEVTDVQQVYMDYRLYCHACSGVACRLPDPVDMGYIVCEMCGKTTPSALQHWIYDRIER